MSFKEGVRITRKKVTFGETAATEEEYKNILRKKRRRGSRVLDRRRFLLV